MNHDQAVQMATEVLTKFDGWDHIERVLKIRENAVLEVHHTDGSRAALRLHREGYQTDAAIRSELEWTSYLGDTGMVVPVPIASDDGTFLVKVGPQRASMIQWVNGVVIADTENPFDWTPEQQRTLHRTLGRQIAELHNVSDTFDAPQGFERPSWDIDGLLGEDPFWGRFWENPRLSDTERDLLNQARTKAKSDLEMFLKDGGDTGLIHADLTRENVFVDGETMVFIDYDDSGFGYRMYDIAVALYRSLDEPLIEEFKAELLAGYRSARTLSDAHWALLDLFLMLRSFALLGWVVPRVEESGGPARSQRYVDATMGHVRAYLTRD